MGVASGGSFFPWRDSFDSNIHATVGRLRNVGLSHTVLALVRAFKLTVLPSLLFGGELWGIPWLYKVMFRESSMYSGPFMRPITTHFCRLLGLPSNTALPIIYKLLNLPTFADLIAPRI